MFLRLALAFVLCAISLCAHAGDAPSRYFVSGDGKIRLVGARSKATFSGAYRLPDGSYDAAALHKIGRVYGAPGTMPATTISVRFIEFLDFLQDRLVPNEVITVVSGYRSPRYNTSLRESGKLAAKASMHQYAMAADVRLGSASSEAVWNFVKALGVGGAGFYHGGLVHVDVGPPRSWDETTSGVFTDISDNNKLIALMTDRDIYRPGESGTLQFIRMTAFPIGVAREVVLECIEKDGAAKKVASIPMQLSAGGAGACPQFASIESLAGIRWQVPEGVAPGRYRIRASFCEKAWEDMPAEAATPEFEVR